MRTDPGRQIVWSLLGFLFPVVLAVGLAAPAVRAGNMWEYHGFNFTYTPPGSDGSTITFPIAWDIRCTDLIFRQYCEIYGIETDWDPMMDILEESMESGFNAAVLRSELLNIPRPEPYGTVHYRFSEMADSIRDMGLDIILGGFLTNPIMDEHNTAVLEYLEGYVQQTAGMFPGDVICIFGFDEPAVKYLENPGDESAWIGMVSEYSDLCAAHLRLPFTSFLSKYGVSQGGVWRYYSDTTSVLNRFSRHLDVVTFNMYPVKSNERRDVFLPMETDSMLFYGTTDLLPSETDYYRAYSDRDEFFSVTVSGGGCRFEVYEFTSAPHLYTIGIRPAWSLDLPFVPTGMAASDFRSCDTGDREAGINSPSGVVVLWDSLAPAGEEVVIHFDGASLTAESLPSFHGIDRSRPVIFGVGDAGSFGSTEEFSGILGRGQPAILGCYQVDGGEHRVIVFTRTPDGVFSQASESMPLVRIAPTDIVWGRFWGEGIPGQDEQLASGGFVLFNRDGFYVTVRRGLHSWYRMPDEAPFYTSLFGWRSDPLSVFVVHEDQGELPFTPGRDYLFSAFTDTYSVLIGVRSFNLSEQLIDMDSFLLTGAEGRLLSAGSFRPDKTYGDVLIAVYEDRVMRSAQTFSGSDVGMLKMEELEHMNHGEVLSGARVMDTRRNIRAGVVIGEEGISLASAELYHDAFDPDRFERYAECYEVAMENGVWSTPYRRNCVFASIQSYGRHTFGLPSYCASRDTLLYMITVPVVKGCRGMMFYGMDIALMSGNRNAQGEITYPDLLQNWGPSRDTQVADMPARIHSVVASLTGNGPTAGPDFLAATVDDRYRVLSDMDAVNSSSGSSGFIAAPGDTLLNFLALENRDDGSVLLLVSNDSEVHAPYGRGIAFPGRYMVDYSMNVVDGFTPLRQIADRFSGAAMEPVARMESEDVLVLGFGGMPPRSASLIELQPLFEGGGPGGSVFLDVIYRAGSAFVSFKVSGRELSTLNLYDITGRQVECIWEGSGFPGVMEFTLDRRSLPCGVYFLVLDSGGFQLTEKVILFG